MLRRVIAWMLLLSMVAWTLPGAASAASVKRPDPNWKVAPPAGISSGASIVLDWRTGQVLYERNAYAKREPASTTKVLTAIIALERGNLSDLVKVSRRASRTVGSSMYIGEGQVYSLHDLLYGLLLRSGNDAAVAIAEHIAGSVEQFASLMNAKARELGAVNSHFMNPHGLTDAQHYSSAYDLAIITRHALMNEKFASIVSRRSAQLTFEEQNRVVDLYNTNKLLGIMPDADGVKTGTTAAAGACLIASATRDEHKLIAVVLHAGNRWSDAARMLNWGFDQFRLARMGQQAEVVAKTAVEHGKTDIVPLALADEIELVVPRKQSEGPKMRIDIQPQIEAPITKGQVLGRAVIEQNGKILAASDLVAAHDVARRTWLDSLYRVLSPLLHWALDGWIL